MAVPFGFSVGDIIAGIGVIKNSIRALNDTQGATKDHKSLSDTLTRLCETLEAVRDLDIDPEHNVRQREAIRQAVDQCQRCIDDLICKIAKYNIIQPGMQHMTWESSVKAAAKKIQWALLKQDDLSKFKTDIQLQFDAITVLLLSFQVHRQQRQVFMLDNIATNQTEAVNIYREHLIFDRSTERIFHANQDKLSNQAVAIEGLRVENAKLLDKTEEQLLIARDTQGLVQALKTSMSEDQCSILQQILQQQASYFQLLIETQSKNYRLLHQQSRNIQLIVDGQSRDQLSMSNLNALLEQITLLNEIPRQVSLQKPVVFRDALDRVTPIHLDFIDSAQAFVAVLKVRFKDIGSEKLDRNEYILTDDKQNRNLDIRKPWCSVMKPGQHVSMSMIFDTSFEQNICPGCSARNKTQKGEETACLTYRLIEEPKVRKAPSSTTRTRQKRSNPQPDAKHNESREKHTLDLGSTSEVTIADFRRVHLINRVEQERSTLNENDRLRMIAQQSYGLLQQEPWEVDAWPSHKASLGHIDRLDGQTYSEVINYLIIKGDSIESIFCIGLRSYHTFSLEERFLCEEHVYVSDTATESHYPKENPRNEGAKLVGRIVVDMTILKERGHLMPQRRFNSEPYFMVEYDLSLSFHEMNLKWEVNAAGMVHATGQISIAGAFLPDAR